MSHPSSPVKNEEDSIRYSFNLKNEDDSVKGIAQLKAVTRKRHQQKLLCFLNDGRKDSFLKEYNSSNLLKNFNDLHIELLKKALYMKPQDEHVIEVIFNNVTDLTFIGNETADQVSLMEAVCRNESFQVYLKIVQDKNLDLSKRRYIVETLICYLKENLFDKWFYNFYYQSIKVDLNMVNDKNITLLRIALMKSNSTAVRRLLKEGAYIGHTSYFNDKHELEPQDVEECFDNCIKRTTKSDSKRIDFDYKNLIHPTKQDHFKEMLPIALILKSRGHLSLLKHPLITSFMALKFQRIAKFLYINLLLFLFYLTSIVTYIILVCQQSESVSLYVILARWCTILGLVYLIIREGVQLLFPKEYLSKPENYMELLLIFLSIWIITMKIYDVMKIVAVIVILLAGTEFCLLVGNLPISSISTHLLMLKQVLRSFLQSFSLYSIFLFMFSISFYVLFTKDEDGTDDENKFGNIFTSVVKTTAMLIGEVDLEGLKFKTNIFSYILFLMFVICMTVVLMNLLNGLAVDDIQAIRQEAELSVLIFRAKFLIDFDFKLFPRHQYKYIKKRIVIERSIYQNYIIGVELDTKNFTNKVILPQKCLPCVKKEGTDEDFKHERSNTSRLIWYIFFDKDNFVHIVDSWINKTTLMESSVVEAAKIIIRNKLNSKNSEFKNIEEKLNMIEKKLFEKIDKIEQCISSIKMTLIENKIKDNNVEKLKCS